MTGLDLVGEVRAAGAAMEAWIRRVGPDGWAQPEDAAWSNQDLLGHLAAWSDLLMDQLEAVTSHQPRAIEEVDIDAWNAAQVARRRDRSAQETVGEWHRAMCRATGTIERLPPDAWDRAWQVTWATEPVSVAGILRIWLHHLDQHHARLGT